MNTKYSLDADTRRWWWAPAAAGALSVVSIAAVVAVSAGSTAVTADPGSRPGLELGRPCFIVQPLWNTALAGPQPTCPLETEAPAPPRRSGALRPWLDTGA